MTRTRRAVTVQFSAAADRGEVKDLTTVPRHQAIVGRHSCLASRELAHSEPPGAHLLLEYLAAALLCLTPESLESQRVLRLARGGYWPAGAADTLQYGPALLIDEAREELLSVPKYQCPGDNLSRRVQCGEPWHELATHEE